LTGVERHWPGAGLRQVVVFDTVRPTMSTKTAARWAPIFEAAVKGWEPCLVLELEVVVAEMEPMPEPSFGDPCPWSGGIRVARNRAPVGDPLHGQYLGSYNVRTDEPEHFDAGLVFVPWLPGEYPNLSPAEFDAKMTRQVQHELAHALGLPHWDPPSGYMVPPYVPDLRDLRAIALPHLHDD
jgi:hypothetical protein